MQDFVLRVVGGFLCKKKYDHNHSFFQLVPIAVDCYVIKRENKKEMIDSWLKGILIGFLAKS